MKKRKKIKKKTASGKGVQNTYALHRDKIQFHDEVEDLREKIVKNEERLEDIEIHVNLLTRLLTTLCVEKLGMRIGVLKRLIKRIEKEAIRDSQILHLEQLYKLPQQSDKKSSNPPSKNDPWDEIS